MADQKRLKLLRVVTTPECVPWHMANTLKRAVEDFDVYVAGQGVSMYQGTYPDIRWVDIPIARKASPASDLCSLFRMCKLIYQYKPDILHSIMPKAGLISAIAGFICRVPVRMHTFTGQVWATKTGAVRFLLKSLDRLVIILNTVCLTDSPSQSKFLYSENISFKGKPLPVLSKGSLSGVDVSRFQQPELVSQAQALRKKIGIADTDYVFAFIARKSLDKGALDVLRAFGQVVRMHAHAKLLFVGPDESGGEVEKMMAADHQLSSHVLNIGRVNNHEVYLALCDVLCLPSYREGFGSIVIDAAAAGVPSIGSNIPGLIDAIEDGKTGTLFPAGNIEELVRTMCIFLENPHLAEEMGRQAKERVNTYFSADVLYSDLKRMYQVWAEIYASHPRH